MIRLLVCSLFCCLLIESAAARWATSDDITFKTLLNDKTIRLQANGRHVIEHHAEYLILREEAKPSFSIYKIAYSSNSTKLKIKEIAVINGTEKIVVPDSQIVERAVAQDVAIDDTREVQATLAQVKVGSKIIVKYTETVERVVVPEHFSISHVYGGNGPEEKSTLLVESEVPLYKEVLDPFKTLLIEETRKAGKHVYSFKLKAPYFHSLAEETGIPEPGSVTLVHLSTDSDWKKIGKNFAKRFSRLKEEKGIKEYQELLKKQEGLGVEAVVNNLTTYIAENYNYVGDWRTIDGSFSPRSLDKIAKSKFGDCKDFSYLLTWLLRQRGFNATVAFVRRSPSYTSQYLEPKLPRVGAFNHAIVHLNHGGKSYWIDPTNETSFGLKHRGDIAGKLTLVLEDNISVMRIPPHTPEHNQYTVLKEIDFNENYAASVRAELKLMGLLALPYIGIEAKLNEKTLQAVYGAISQGENPLLLDMGKLDLRSKTYRDLHFKAKYSTQNLTSKNDEKRLLSIPGLNSIAAPFFSTSKNWEGMLPVGDPFKISKVTKYNKIFFSEILEGCDLDSPWFSLKRKYDYHNTGLTITEELIFKQELIKNEDIKSDQFSMMAAQAFSCLEDNALVVAEGQTKHAEGIGEIARGFMKLKGKERLLERIKYVEQHADQGGTGSLREDDATFLMKKNIEEDPKFLETYGVWARMTLFAGYYNGDNYNPASVLRAREIVEQGLTVEPLNTSLQLLMLRIEWLRGNKDMVKGAFPHIMKRAKIETVADVYAAANIYSYLGETQKGIDLFETKIKSTKDKGELAKLHFKLAMKYAEIDNNPKAILNYEQVLKLKPTDKFTHTNLPTIYLRSKNFDRAVEVSRDGLKLMKGGMMATIAAMSLNARGTNYLKLNKTKEAEADFMEALGIRKTKYGYIGMAKLAITQGDANKALGYIHEGANSVEDDLGMYYTEAADSFDDKSPLKIELLKKSFELSRDPVARMWTGKKLGYLLGEIKKKADAKEYLTWTIRAGEEMTSKHGENSKVLGYVGASYSMLGINEGDQSMITKGVDLMTKSKLLDPRNTSVDYYQAHVRRFNQTQTKPSANKVNPSKGTSKTVFTMEEIEGLVIKP